MTKRGMTVSLIVLVGFGASILATAEQQEGKTSGPKVRIGTFDSRAVAFAYFGSEEFNRQLNGLRAKHEKAKAAGKEKRQTKKYEQPENT